MVFSQPGCLLLGYLLEDANFHPLIAPVALTYVSSSKMRPTHCALLSRLSFSFDFRRRTLFVAPMNLLNSFIQG